MELRETVETIKKWNTDGDLTMKVPVLVAGRKNRNGRTYPIEVVRAAVAELKPKLAKGSTLGSTAHKKSMEVDDVSHIIEDLTLEKDTLHATIRILPTARGKNLMAILKHGGSLGLSTRGQGDTTADGVVKEGYKLLGIDFTTSPSFDTYTNQAMFESAPIGKIEVIHETIMPSEAEIKRRYEFAKSQGIVKTSFEQYKATYRPDRATEAAFARARVAGFKGSFETFKQGLKKQS